MFDVRVFNEETLSATYRVAQDGTIDFPLVGQLNVAGARAGGGGAPSLSRTSYSRQLLRGDPQVSVFVQEYFSKRVSVVGAVATPGNFPVSSGLTLVQVISLAGGFSDMADRNGTTLSRRVDGELQRFPRARGRDHVGPRQTCPCSVPGDIINVPRRVF